MIFPIVTVFLILSGVHGAIDEAIVRTLSHDEKGRTTTSYSDGVSYLVAEFSSNANLLDCDYVKEFSTASRNYLKEIMENGIEDQHITTLDVARLGRKCKKFHRDMDRGVNTNLNKIRDHALSFNRLQTLVPGTTHCTLGDLNSTSTVPRDPINECCKVMHGCKYSVEGYETKYFMFNPYPYTLVSCDCLNSLRQCLSGTDNTNTRRAVEDLYFSQHYSRCLEVERENRCLEWNKWGNFCMKSEVADVTKIKFIK